MTLNWSNFYKNKPDKPEKLLILNKNIFAEFLRIFFIIQ